MLQVSLKARRILKSVPSDGVAERLERAAAGGEPAVHCGVDFFDGVSDLRVAVVVGVLGEGAVVELDEKWERSQPGFEVGVRGDGVEVGPVAAAAEPEVLDAEAIARVKGAELVAAAGALDHHEQEQVVVAEHRSGVATGHRQACRCGAAAGAGFAALEEVAEEDRVDVVLGVGLERLPQPVDVPLNVADDEGRSRHGLQDTFVREFNRPRPRCVCGRRELVRA